MCNKSVREKSSRFGVGKQVMARPSSRDMMPRDGQLLMSMCAFNATK